MVESKNTNENEVIESVAMTCDPEMKGNSNSNTAAGQKCCKGQIRESSEESCDALAIAEILQKFRQSPFVAQEDKMRRTKTSMEEDSLNRKRKECCNHQDIVSNKEKAIKRDFDQKNSVYSQVQDNYPNVVTPMFSPIHSPPQHSFPETATQQGKSAVREIPALYHIIHLGSGGSSKESFHAFATLLHGRKPEETRGFCNTSSSQMQLILPRIDSEARTCLDILQQFNKTLPDTRQPINPKPQDNTPHSPNDHSTYSKQKICRMEGCSNPSAKRSPYCTQHSGVRRCEHPSCQKCAQGQTRFCIAHGGGRRCIYPNCTKAARDQRFCAAHGGGRRCCETGCHKLAVGKSNKCTAHGGGRRCQAESCNKAAQSRSNYCVRHGGGRKCMVQGCVKVARGKTMLCMSHSRMKATAASVSKDESPANLCPYAND